MIDTILHTLQTIGASSLTVFWLPVAAWTMAALPLYLYLRRMRPASPLIRYRALQAILAALPLGLAAAALVDAWSLLFSAAASTEVAPAVLVLPSLPGTASAAAAPALWNPYVVLGGAIVVAGLLALARLARLAYHAISLYRFRKNLSAHAAPALEQNVQRQAAAMGIGRPVQLRLAPQPDLPPMTFGGRRPVIVLPAHLTDDLERLEMTLTHELVHIRHRDYAAQWIEHLIGALFAVHPFVAMVRRSVATAREMTCDAAVVSASPGRRKHYAALLYDLALPEQPPLASTVGITEDATNLKDRIQAMNAYTPASWNSKHAVAGLSALLLVTVIGVVACSDMVGVEQEPEATPAARTAEHESSDTEVFVAVEDQPQMLPDQEAAMLQMQQEIEYPEMAKRAGIEGRVIVQFIVDEAGNVTDAEVIQGKGGGLDAEAKRVVQTLQFEPGKQRGKPVKVRMAIPINFVLPDGEESAADPDAVVRISGDGTVRIDDSVVSTDGLSEELQSRNASHVALAVDGQAEMGVVNAVQQAIRDGGVLKINYTSGK